MSIEVALLDPFFLQMGCFRSYYISNIGLSFFIRPDFEATRTRIREYSKYSNPTNPNLKWVGY
ncbi:hypothetical protein Hanom_Chr06g00488811 [Helianthus anomalus]